MAIYPYRQYGARFDAVAVNIDILRCHPADSSRWRAQTHGLMPHSNDVSEPTDVVGGQRAIAKGRNLGRGSFLQLGPVAKRP